MKVVGGDVTRRIQPIDQQQENSRGEMSKKASTWNAGKCLFIFTIFLFWLFTTYTYCQMRGFVFIHYWLDLKISESIWYINFYSKNIEPTAVLIDPNQRILISPADPLS